MRREPASDEATRSLAERPDARTRDARIASGALVAAGLTFFVGGALVVVADTPPSTAPVLGMLAHASWALSIAILTLGAVALLRSVEAPRIGIAGYLATGVLGLGVLNGLQWLTWAYVDVRASGSPDHDLALGTVIEPFGAGYLLMYAVLLGVGVALLGWALRRTGVSHGYVDWSGVVLGSLAAIGATIAPVSALGGGAEGHLLFDATTLLLPVLYLWAMALGVFIYRRG